MVPMEMDEVRTTNTETVNDIPPVPIKTYKWEDVRREKEKGLYPYTHLTKEPYNEEVDVEEFKMDTLRTSKSASTLRKSSSGIDIQEITEVKDSNNDKNHLEVTEGIVETGDSSNEDNVSQYLDKEEDPPIITEHVETPGPSKEEENMEVDKNEQRAKSEEPKRKRKLSIESSYSRISLSKLGVMKKLREAKEKLKLPKFSFSKSESKLDIPKKSKKEVKEDKKKKMQKYLEPKKVEGPLFIHIPLKPPPGQTDEFSYLEFEDPKPTSSTTPIENVSAQNNDSEKNNGETDQQKEGLQFIILTPPSDDETLDSRVTSPDTPSSESGKKFFDNARLKDLKSLAKECIDEITPDMPIEGIFFEDVIQVEYVDEHNRPIGTSESSNVLEVTEANLSTIEKKLSQRNLAKELEKDIASSMDSLHKIARQNTLKKLREAKRSKSNEALRKSANKPKKTQEAPELSATSVIVKPVIKVQEAPAKITSERITLKKDTEQKNEKIEDDKTTISANDTSKEAKPEIKATDDVKESKNLEENETKEDILLKNTDIIEDKNVAISKGNKDEATADEKKKEFQKSPEEKTPPAENSKAAMYDEEDGLKLSETAVQMINEELVKEQLPKTNEDQLKAAANSIKKKVSFKRRSKQQDPDGVYEDVRVTSDNKKVDGKEQQTKELKVVDTSQSMSVDEEKTYLDDKIMKTTSLEEDYNKWSKLNDHEYEPINAPPTESVNQQSLPTSEVKVTDVTVKRSSSKQSKHSDSGSIRIPLKDEDITRSEEEVDSGDAITVEEMQARIEDRFFNQPSPPIEQEVTTDATSTTPTTTTAEKENPPQASQAKKIQDAFRNQADKIRTKIKNIHMPQRPNLDKLKIQKPNITLPKIPDKMHVNLPSFTLPKKGTSTRKRPVKQYSTESNVGDSKKKLFDFSTYPRIFKRKKKPDDFEDDALNESATVPRVSKSVEGKKDKPKKSKETNKKKKSPEVRRIPLHSEESMDKEENDLSSHGRYEEENIDMGDAYLRESQQMNTASAHSGNDFARSRWNHGSFHGRNIEETSTGENAKEKEDISMEAEVERTQTSPELEPEPEPEPKVEHERLHSEARSLVGSSGEVHGPGVLEKINSDEYFMQMGNNTYLTAEIREAFKQPNNPLAKLDADDSFDREFDVSDQSIQEAPKRKPLKKPKRKKTPNVSKERIPYDEESEGEEYPKPYNDQPARPKRRSKKNKDANDDKPPYQDTIFVPDAEFEMVRKSASDNILLSDKNIDNRFQGGLFRQEYAQFYENEKMHGIEQPQIMVSNIYHNRELNYNGDLEDVDKEVPEAPPRKQRSLKSLISEHDSITDEINQAKQILTQPHMEIKKLEYEYIIPTPEEPPVRPARSRTRTRSQSRATNPTEDESQAIEAEVCVEEPCVQQVCDYMGYAVIDKTKHRDPPLPPPSRKKKLKQSDAKFSTVPRPLKDDTPVRPLRNYSTLVPKSKRSPPNSGEDEKENVDLGQYIEIEDEDEHSRLQSGEIVQKMKDRPLPAPPRPPRKGKESDRDGPFRDITHKTNFDLEEPLKAKLEEAEASVQTEPLPDDVVCEELVEEKGDKIIIPTTSKQHPAVTEFENVETVTHAALVVTPVPHDFQEGPIASFSRSTEKIITIRREVDNEETSDVPESFRTLSEPQPKIIERIIERPTPSNSEVDVLKAQKLQVSDLDVDRLTVNELLASKIKVSEIDSDSISVAEINPKSGNLVIGGVELPMSFIQEIVDRLRYPEASNENRPERSVPKGESTEKPPSKEESTEQQSELSKDNAKSIETANDDVSSCQTENSSTFVIKQDDRQPLLSDEQEPTVTSNAEETPLKDDTTVFEAKLTSEAEEIIPSELDNQLSPTTIRTIEYLDGLIEDEIKSNLETKSGEANKSEVNPTDVGAKEEDNTTLEQYLVEEGHEEIEEIPPLIPDSSEEDRLIAKLEFSEQKRTSIEDLSDGPPRRPPRQSDVHRLRQSQEDIFIPSRVIQNSNNNIHLGDSTPPPRPPDPEERFYLRSQPPPSFFVLSSPALGDFVDEDIPMPPRRKRAPRPPSRSSSDEALPATPRSRRHRTPEASIPQLTGQLTRACMSAGERAFRRLIKHITMNVLRNADGKQDLHVMILILLILIAGLILLGNGGNPAVHHYHWEYFNPPRDL